MPPAHTAVMLCRGRERRRFVTLDVPGASVTEPFAINDAGRVVGGYKDAAGVVRGFQYDRGRFRTIDAPEGPATTVRTSSARMSSPT